MYSLGINPSKDNDIKSSKNYLSDKKSDGDSEKILKHCRTQAHVCHQEIIGYANGIANLNDENSDATIQNTNKCNGNHLRDIDGQLISNGLKLGQNDECRSSTWSNFTFNSDEPLLKSNEHFSLKNHLDSNFSPEKINLSCSSDSLENSMSPESYTCSNLQKNKEIKLSNSDVSGISESIFQNFSNDTKMNDTEPSVLSNLNTHKNIGKYDLQDQEMKCEYSSFQKTISSSNSTLNCSSDFVDNLKLKIDEAKTDSGINLLNGDSLFSDTPDDSQNELLNDISNAVSSLLDDAGENSNSGTFSESNALFSGSNSPSSKHDINFRTAFKILNIIEDDSAESNKASGISNPQICPSEYISSQVKFKAKQENIIEKPLLCNVNKIFEETSQEENRNQEEVNLITNVIINMDKSNNQTLKCISYGDSSFIKENPIINCNKFNGEFNTSSPKNISIEKVKNEASSKFYNESTCEYSDVYHDGIKKEVNPLSNVPDLFSQKFIDLVLNRECSYYTKCSSLPFCGLKLSTVDNSLNDIQNSLISDPKEKCLFRNGLNHKHECKNVLNLSGNIDLKFSNKISLDLEDERIASPIRKECTLTKVESDVFKDLEYDLALKLESRISALSHLENVMKFNGCCDLCTDNVSYDDLMDHSCHVHICTSFIPIYYTFAFIHHTRERIDNVETPYFDALYGSPQHICKECGQIFKSMNDVRRHLNCHQNIFTIVTGDNVYSCSCETLPTLDVKQKWSAQLRFKSTICCICDCNFACQNGLINHMISVHFSSNKCRICKESVNYDGDEMIKHNSLHNDVLQYNRNLCNVFKTQTTLFSDQLHFSWATLDNSLNYLDGKSFRVHLKRRNKKSNGFRDNLLLPMKVDPQIATVPVKHLISPNRLMLKYVKDKTEPSFKMPIDCGNLFEKVELNVQFILKEKLKAKQKKISKKPVSKKMMVPYYLGLQSANTSDAIEHTNKFTKKRSKTKKRLRNRGKQKLNKQHLNSENKLLDSRLRSGLQNTKPSVESQKQIEPNTEISGEWVNVHTFVCCSCGAVFLDLAEIMDHKWHAHPSVWCAHTMIRGQEKVPELFKEQFYPAVKSLPSLPVVSPKKKVKLSKNLLVCTQCKVKFEETNEFHSHVVECGGLNQIIANKKKIKKGFRFYRRKGQGVPRRHFSHLLSPHKSRSIEAGVSTPGKHKQNLTKDSLNKVKKKLILTSKKLRLQKLNDIKKATAKSDKAHKLKQIGLRKKRGLRMLKIKSDTAKNLSDTKMKSQRQSLSKKSDKEEGKAKIHSKKSKKFVSKFRRTELDRLKAYTDRLIKPKYRNIKLKEVSVKLESLPESKSLTSKGLLNFTTKVKSVISKQSNSLTLTNKSVKSDNSTKNSGDLSPIMSSKPVRKGNLRSLCESRGKTTHTTKRCLRNITGHNFRSSRKKLINYTDLSDSDSSEKSINISKKRNNVKRKNLKNSGNQTKIINIQNKIEKESQTIANHTNTMPGKHMMVENIKNNSPNKKLIKSYNSHSIKDSLKSNVELPVTKKIGPRKRNSICSLDEAKFLCKTNLQESTKSPPKIPRRNSTSSIQHFTKNHNIFETKSPELLSQNKKLELKETKTTEPVIKNKTLQIKKSSKEKNTPKNKARVQKNKLKNDKSALPHNLNVMSSSVMEDLLEKKTQKSSKCKKSAKYSLRDRKRQSRITKSIERPRRSTKIISYDLDKQFQDEGLSSSCEDIEENSGDNNEPNFALDDFKRMETNSELKILPKIKTHLNNSSPKIRDDTKSLSSTHKSTKTLTEDTNKHLAEPFVNSKKKSTAGKNEISESISSFKQGIKSVLKEAQLITCHTGITDTTVQNNDIDNSTEKSNTLKKEGLECTKGTKKKFRNHLDENSPSGVPSSKRFKRNNDSFGEDSTNFFCIDCGLSFDSAISCEEHQQDCRNIAFEMSLMADDHLYECPHCQSTFALKGSQRKHTASCKLRGRTRKFSRRRKRTSGDDSKEPASISQTKDSCGVSVNSSGMDVNLFDKTLDIDSIASQLSLCQDNIGIKEICLLLYSLRTSTEELRYVLLNKSVSQNSTTVIKSRFDELISSTAHCESFDMFLNILSRPNCKNLKSYLEENVEQLGISSDSIADVHIENVSISISTSTLTVNISQSDLLNSLNVIKEILHKFEVAQSVAKNCEMLNTMRNNFQAGTVS